MKHIGLSILATLLLAACTARASDVIIVLDSSTLPGSTWSVLHFFGTLTNTTGADVYLNGDNFNTASFPDPSAITDLFVNTPLSLPPNGTSDDIELFDVTILPSFTLPSYGGTYTLLGGSAWDSQDTLDSVDFTVQVLPAQPSSGVPEPGTLPLLGFGACSLLVWGRVMRGIGRCGAR